MMIMIRFMNPDKREGKEVKKDPCEKYKEISLDHNGIIERPFFFDLRCQ